MTFAEELRQVVEEAKGEYERFYSEWDSLREGSALPLFREAAPVLGGNARMENGMLALIVGHDYLSLEPVKDGPWPKIRVKSTIRNDEEEFFDLDALHDEVIKRKIKKFARALQCPECRSRRR